MPPYSPGHMLSHYRILEKLGEGGMGVVYKALDVRLHRQVAIKVLPEELSGDHDRRRRFLHEARAAAAVNHARLATIHEVDHAGGCDFIVMEVVQGPSLRQTLREGRLPLGRALRLAAEIADGLAHAHAAHIVHRDLKPENVVLDAEGHAKILDFGLARLAEERNEALRSRLSQAETDTGALTREGQILGTTAYLSPEQARGETAGPQSDLFALGIILYEMLTGERPFQGRTPIETLSAILKDTPRPVAQRNPAVPAEVDAAIARCLEKDPAQRYPEAAALRDELERQAAESATPTAPRRDWMNRRRPGLLAVAASSIILAALATAALMALLSRRPQQAASASPRILSLVVLPLRNLSGSSEQDYFAEGMTEELITRLSRLGTLRVVSHSASMRYQGTSRSASEIASELKVDALVEGSVRRSGDRVRISASLQKIGTDSNLWADSYERDLRDVLSLQSDVAGAIVRALRTTLSPGEQERLAGPQKVDPEAYQLYLKGRYQFNKFAGESIRKSIELYQQALDRDPAYAPAWLGIADAYQHMSGTIASSKLVLPKARAAVLRAIKLDDSLAAAYTTLGAVTLALDRDWAGTEAAYRRAIEINPGDAQAHSAYGLFLTLVTRSDEAVVELTRAEELDPLSPYFAVGVAFPLIFALPEKRDLRRSVHILEGVLETDPSFAYAHVNLAVARSLLGECDAAVNSADQAVDLNREEPGIFALVGSVYALCGGRQRAEESLAAARGRDGAYHFPFDAALTCVSLGRIEEGFRLLEVAYAEGDEALLQLRIEPRLDPIRSDPRYLELVRRMGFPPGPASQAGKPPD